MDNVNDKAVILMILLLVLMNNEDNVWKLLREMKYEWMDNISERLISIEWKLCEWRKLTILMKANNEAMWRMNNIISVKTIILLLMIILIILLLF